MPLHTVNVNGKKFVVDSPNKGTSKAFGRRQIDVSVEDATGSDVQEFIAAGYSIEKLLPAEPAAEPTAE